MLSWVFRHRARLGVIYGITPALPASNGKGALQNAPGLSLEVRTSQPEDLYLPVESENQYDLRLEPGRWVRRSRYVLMRPMRPGRA